MVGLLALFNLTMSANPHGGHVARHGMQVTWRHRGDRVHFTVSAPTSGWVGIGFNERDDVVGAHLILTHVLAGRAAAVEYSVLAAGDYRPITSLGGSSGIADIAGDERNGVTTVHFSLPQVALGTRQRALSPDRAYFMIMAFSAEDDFAHHSRMRTSVAVTL